MKTNRPLMNQHVRVLALRAALVAGASGLAAACASSPERADLDPASAASGDATGSKDGPQNGPNAAAPIVAVSGCNAEVGSPATTYEGKSSGTDLIVLAVEDPALSFVGRTPPPNPPASLDTVVVRDTRPDPHVLVLSVLTTARWQIDAKGSGLQRVLFASPAPQTVDAPEGVEVTDLNVGRPRPLPNAHQWPWGGPDDHRSADTQTLVRELQTITGLTLTGFAGCSAASAFDIKGGTPAGAPLPDDPCAGTEGVDPSESAVFSFRRDCASRSLGSTSGERSCAETLADCRQQAEQDPAQSFSCTWGSRIIFEHEATPGACSSLKTPEFCAGAEGVSDYGLTFCSPEADGPGPQMSCAEAVDECLLFAGERPGSPVTCTWGGKPIHTQGCSP